MFSAVCAHETIEQHIRLGYFINTFFRNIFAECWRLADMKSGDISVGRNDGGNTVIGISLSN